MQTLLRKYWAVSVSVSLWRRLAELSEGGGGRLLLMDDPVAASRAGICHNMVELLVELNRRFDVNLW